MTNTHTTKQDNLMERIDSTMTEEKPKSRLPMKQTPPKDNWVVTGERLRAIRKAKQLKQHELSDLFGFVGGQAHISALERGAIGMGRNTRERYILLTGANPDFIDHGHLPMFKKLDRRKETTAETVMNLMAHRTQGNLRVVGRGELAQFLNTGLTNTSIRYGFIPGDCYSLPVTSYELGPDFPIGSQIICTRFLSTSNLLPGKLYAFQTGSDLIVRYFGGLDHERGMLNLTAPYGPPIELPVDEVKFFYHVERVDKPV